MSVTESSVDRESGRCKVSVRFQEETVVIRPQGLLDATAADLLIELVRAAKDSGVEVSVDFTGLAA